MRYILYLAAVVQFLLAVSLLAIATTSIHEILAGVGFVVWAALLSGAAVCSAVDRLRRELLERFRGFGRVPPLDEIKREASRLVVNYIATVRVVGGGGDVFVPALTPRYAAWKAARGKGSKPVGVFTGRWMQALLRQGHADARAVLHA